MAEKKKRPLFSGISLEAANLLREYKPFAYNEWTMQAEMAGAPVDDDTIREISFWLQGRTGQEWTKEKIWDAVIMLAKAAPYNPLVKYLTEEIQWAGEDAIKKLVDILQPNDPLAYTYMKRWLISAVRRAINPGEKADAMLILVGMQGIGKSRFARAICPLAEKGYFLEDFNAKITREEKMKIRGVWIAEMSELKGMREANLTALKSFLSAREDAYRVPWGRVPLVVPRRCVFIGTTNETAFLRDETGERRFMVIESQTPLGLSWPEAEIAALRDQVWAQAVALVAAGEQSWLTKEEAELQRENNKFYEEEDPWTDRILAMVGDKKEIQRPLDLLLMAFDFDGIKVKDVGKAEQNRVCAILKKNGWENVRRTLDNGKRIRVWINPNPKREGENVEAKSQFLTVGLTNGFESGRLN